MKLSELPRLLETSGFANRTEGQEAPDLIGVNTLRNANKGALSFLTTSQYREPMRNARASAAVVERAGPAPEDWPALRCTNPHGAVAAAMGAEYRQPGAAIAGPSWRSRHGSGRAPTAALRNSRVSDD